MKCRVFVSLLAAVFVWGSTSSDAAAAFVTGWGLETGFQNATLTEGVAGSFSTTVPTGNAAPRALLSSPFDFADVGDMALLCGTVTMSNAPGNQQLRFGLFDTNGRNVGTLSGGLWSGADATGWLGYMVQVGGGGGNDDTKGRNATGAWLSNTGAYSIGTGPGGATSPPATTPYDFTLKLTRTGATSVQVDYSFVGGSVNRSGSYIDNNLGASVGAQTFNAVGFLLNSNTGSGTFANVKVIVPEPATATIVAALLLPAVLLLRRRVGAR